MTDAGDPRGNTGDEAAPAPPPGPGLAAEWMAVPEAERKARIRAAAAVVSLSQRGAIAELLAALKWETERLRRELAGGRPPGSTEAAAPAIRTRGQGPLGR